MNRLERIESIKSMVESEMGRIQKANTIYK